MAFTSSYHFWRSQTSKWCSRNWTYFVDGVSPPPSGLSSVSWAASYVLLIRQFFYSTKYVSDEHFPNVLSDSLLRFLVLWKWKKNHIHNSFHTTTSYTVRDNVISNNTINNHKSWIISKRMSWESLSSQDPEGLFTKLVSVWIFSQLWSYSTRWSDEKWSQFLQIL